MDTRLVSEPTRALGADLDKDIEHGSRRRRSLVAHDRRLDAADRQGVLERTDGDRGWVDDDVEVVGERDALTCGDESLRFDRFVASAGGARAEAASWRGSATRTPRWASKPRCPCSRLPPRQQSAVP